MKNLNDVKEILKTAKPEIVGVDKSAADLFEDISFSFDSQKVDGSISDEKDIKSLTMLSITKDSDKNAINAAYYA